VYERYSSTRHRYLQSPKVDPTRLENINNRSAKQFEKLMQFNLSNQLDKFYDNLKSIYDMQHQVNPPPKIKRTPTSPTNNRKVSFQLATVGPD
jgi:hypothetical protein